MGARLAAGVGALLALFAIGSMPVLADTAEVYTTADPALVREVARGYGSAELEKDKVGDPTVKGKTEGLGYRVYFYSCTDGKDCKSIQFQAGFDMKRMSLDKVNSWNTQKRYLKAELDEEDDPIVRYDYTFNGGVTRNNLDEVFELFTSLLKDFAKHIGYEK